MTTPYSTKDNIKQKLTGDVPVMSDAWDNTLTSIILQVSTELDREVAKARGCGLPWSFVADTVASERLYNTIRGGIRYLPIDDCIEIEQVNLYSSPGVLQRTLTLNTDWVPKNGDAPIVGIYRTSGTWPDNQILGVGVVAKWGYALSAPADVVAACDRESIREYLEARSGDDDKVGSHVFGTVVISKAFTQKTMQLIATYGYGGAQARG